MKVIPEKGMNYKDNRLLKHYINQRTIFIYKATIFIPKANANVLEL